MVIPGPVTRNLFFTGKGGVGKTSIASATAVGLAEQGKRVLLVSTDPASNLDEVFRRRAGYDARRPIPSVPDLFAMNIDPEAAAHAYRERMVGPYRGILPDASVRSMEEQFSGACTSRSRRSTSSRGSWAMPRRRPSSTTSSSTRLRPDTRCGCCNCPRPGRCSSRTTSGATPAWGRSRASPPSGPSTRRR